jgi:hypothetical protein
MNELINSYDAVSVVEKEVRPISMSMVSKSRRIIP